MADLGPYNFCIIAHHNFLLKDIRNAFICEYYYSAITGACALGERILNHLTIDLRPYYSKSEIYPKIVRQQSFNNWDLMLEALVEWQVLLSNVSQKFRQLHKVRRQSIHYTSQLTDNLRETSLFAVKLIQDILFEQFSSFGPQPWFIENTPGESYIKKEFEAKPFIKTYFIPNSHFVGPYNKVINFSPIKFSDEICDTENEIDDTEFRRLRTDFRKPPIT